MSSDAIPPDSRLREALRRLGAHILRVDEDGGIDFLLRGMDGFARTRRGLFRASFFLSFDPDPAEAERWIRAHADLDDAQLQHIDVDGGSALRVLVELPFGEQSKIWAAAETAQALRSAWDNRNYNGASDLRATLNAAGIAVPDFGSVAQEDLRVYGPWAWGNRYLSSTSLYLFEAELIARQLLVHGPIFAMSHAGHGINSYGLNLVVTSPSGEFAAFVQHGYGGIHANPLADLIAINATYTRLRILLRATKDHSSSRLRWLLLYSEFREACGVIDLAQLQEGRSFEGALSVVGSERAAFEVVSRHLGLSGQDFCAGGDFSW